MKSASEPFYVSRLKGELEKRKEKNKKYSLRSFAQLLNIDSSTLSHVLKKKRPFPVQRIDIAVKKLKFTEDEMHSFYQSVIQERFLVSSRPVAAKQDILTEELHFEILSQWEYYAVLTLFELKDFSAEPKYIAKKLGLTQARAETVWQGLEKSGLIARSESGVWEKKSPRFVTSEDVNSLALRIAHLEELELARQKLHQTPVLEKDYSSTTVAIPKRNLMKAKNLIRRFRKEFCDLVEHPGADSVYLLALQFFPLTKS